MALFSLCRPQFYEPVFMLLLGTVQVQGGVITLGFFPIFCCRKFGGSHLWAREWWCLNHWIFFQSFKTVAGFQGLSKWKGLQWVLKMCVMRITVDSKADWQERTHFLVRMAFSPSPWQLQGQLLLVQIKDTTSPSSSNIPYRYEVLAQI